MFSSSSSSSDYNVLSSPFRLTSDAHIQLQSQPEVTTATTTPAATATTTFTAKRTRSGTIVPSSYRTHNTTNTPNSSNTNDPPGTRRTRSGTLVGPLPSTASGSGVVGNGNLSIRR